MIGVYDSGYGGLSVLGHLRRALPEHDFVYLGDNGRAPYGGRDVGTLLDFAEQAVERLQEEGCALVVVACHTISCIGLRHLQRRYAPKEGSFRVLGVTIPGAELAVRHTRGHVGVLATARTVASGTWATEIGKLDPSVRVSQVAAPLLAAIVEEGWEDGVVARESVARYLERLPRGVDTLVLGCTHYPLLGATFRAVVPPETIVLDPGPFVAERLVGWIERHEAPAPGHGALRVLCTGDPLAFRSHGARFLGSDPGPVVAIGERHGRLQSRDPRGEPVGQVLRP